MTNPLAPACSSQGDWSRARCDVQQTRRREVRGLVARVGVRCATELEGERAGLGSEGEGWEARRLGG